MWPELKHVVVSHCSLFTQHLAPLLGAKALHSHHPILPFTHTVIQRLMVTETPSEAAHKRPLQSVDIKLPSINVISANLN